MGNINQNAEVTISVKEMGDIVTSCTKNVVRAAERAGNDELGGLIKELLLMYSADLMTQMFTDIDNLEIR